jgi:hypothetical protein
MKRNIYFYVVFFAVILYSCKDVSIEKDKSNQSAENKVTENVLFTGETVYSKILRTDTKILGYSSQKDNSLSKEFLEILDETTSQLDSTNSAMKVKGFGAVSLTVNGINLSDLSNNIPSGLQRIKAAAPVLYGQNVSFTLSRNIPQNIKGSQKSKFSILSDTTVTMYVPELVEISSPKVETSKDLMPYCFYKDFVLKWNTDLKNENGLVVVVEWSGMYVTGQKENKYVRNIDVITDDNGSTTLKNEIFNGIPENAIAFITLLRGNIAIVDDYYSKQGNVDPYSLIAESHAILPFVLVRNLN